MYILMSFDKHIHLCKHHPRNDTECFQHSTKFLPNTSFQAFLAPLT